MEKLAEKDIEDQKVCIYVAHNFDGGKFDDFGVKESLIR